MCVEIIQEGLADIFELQGLNCCYPPGSESYVYIAE